jgi:hypothetical protein
VVREGSVSVAEGDCCEFDLMLQFCTVQFFLRGAWEAAVELSSDQAGRGGLSSSRFGPFSLGLYSSNHSHHLGSLSLALLALGSLLLGP